MPLRLIPEVFDPLDGVAPLGEFLRGVDPEGLERRNVEHVVGLVAVAVDDAVWDHFLLDDAYEGLALGVRHDLGVHLAAALQEAENGRFSSGTAPALALADAAEVAFVDFDLALESSSEDISII